MLRQASYHCVCFGERKCKPLRIVLVLASVGEVVRMAVPVEVEFLGAVGRRKSVGRCMSGFAYY